MSGATPALAGHTLTVDGTEVLVQGTGDDTLLMLHGWPDTLALWDATVAALADRYRCARLTLPGFDHRQPPLPRAPTLAQMTTHLRAIVDQVSPGRPVILLVHDWGCLFGYELALRDPGRVARVVGVDVGDHNSGRLRQSLRPRQRLGVLGYQLWLAIAWQLGRLGARRLADGMTRRMARGVRCPSDLSVVHSGMNYPYAMRWFGTSGGLAGALPVALPMPMLL
jgi:cis-3-alkyl-4-acyloxetan-2-one decarboxylase